MASGVINPPDNRRLRPADSHSPVGIAELSATFTSEVQDVTGTGADRGFAGGEFFDNRCASGDCGGTPMFDALGNGATIPGGAL